MSSSSESYADIAAKGPKQSFAVPAPPHPPQLECLAAASTSSLVDVDVDTPSVRTVSFDFGSQEVETETQAARLEREAVAKAAVEEEFRKKGASKKVQARNKAIEANNWVSSKLAFLGHGGSVALGVVNFASLVALSGFLGWKGWDLYERGRLGWKHAGVGTAAVLGVMAFEGLYGGWLHKAKNQTQ